MPSIGLVANVYQEAAALPGMLENAAQFFDDIFIYHTGPGGKYSTDGTIEILEKAGVRMRFGDISKGFGTIRTHLIRYSQADWMCITDADERWWPTEPLLDCHGTEKYPENKIPALTTTQKSETRPRELLLKLIGEAEDRGAPAVRLSRRHWMKDPGDWTHPCQNWQQIPDWQLRVLKNSPHLFYDPAVRMHERLLDSRTWSEPEWVTGNQNDGPFLNHYHIWAKGCDGAQNEEDAQIYEALDKGVVDKMWLSTTKEL